MPETRRRRRRRPRSPPTPPRPPPKKPHNQTKKQDAHERAAVAEAAPRLAALLANAANEGTHAVHEAQTAIAAEAALLLRELSRLQGGAAGAGLLPAWAAAAARLREALKHAGDVAHSARRASAEARALEEVLAEDAERWRRAPPG